MQDIKSKMGAYNKLTHVKMAVGKYEKLTWCGFTCTNDNSILNRAESSEFWRSEVILSFDLDKILWTQNYFDLSGAITAFINKVIPKNIQKIEVAYLLKLGT